MPNDKPSVLHIHFWVDIRNSAGSIEKVITAFASHGERYRHLVACCPTESTPPSSFEHRGVTVHTFRENRLANRVFNKIQNGLLHAIALMEEEKTATQTALLDRVQERVDAFHPPRVAWHLEDIYDTVRGMEAEV